MKVPYSWLTEQFLPNKNKVEVEDVQLNSGFEVEATLAAIRDELKSCRFILGPQVTNLEGEMAMVCGTRYAVGVNSGTDALFLALKALDIGPGDEVLTTPNSFIASTGAIAQTGAIPTFCDVGDDQNLDPNLLEEAITTRTKAILPVHLRGNPADMAPILQIAAKHNLHVVEDAAQAIGASIDEKPVGSFGIAAGFSLHPLKNINVWGDGGVLTTNSAELNSRVRMLRNHGLKNRDEAEMFGYNSRLDTIQAIVALHVLRDLDRITNARIANAAFYDQNLADLGEYIKTPQRKDNVRHVFHTYVIQAERRDQLVRYLTENGVEAKIHYAMPLHLQKCCDSLGYKVGDFPVCEAQCKRVLTLPVHQHLTEEQLSYVVDTIHVFYQG